jgi:hypothetical protein
MRYLRAARFGALSWLLWYASLAPAQERPGPVEDPRTPVKKPETSSKSAAPALPAPLSDDGLGDVLRQLGHQPEITKLSTGRLIHRVKIQKEGITLLLDVERSSDGNKVWLSTWFKQLVPEQQIPAEVMLKMLDANSLYGPCHFQYNAPSRQLVLALPLDNRGLTKTEMQRQIAVFADVFRITEPLWNSAKWSSAANGK